MKYYIENGEESYGWKISNFGAPYTIYLDNGDQSLVTVTINKEEYEMYEVEQIAKGIASFLGIESECTF